MRAQTIPIYWGDPTIDRFFNLESFVHVKTFPNKAVQLKEFDRVVERIREIDQNPEIYRNLVAQQFYTDLALNRESTLKSDVRNFVSDVFRKESSSVYKELVEQL